MSEYIEREAVKAMLKRECSPRVMAYLADEVDKLPAAFEDAQIAPIPAADVRPVVLCRDCKWYQIDELKKDGTADRRYKPSVCVLAEQRRDPNHFCADGKKREGEI